MSATVAATGTKTKTKRGKQPKSRPRRRGNKTMPTNNNNNNNNMNGERTVTTRPQSKGKMYHKQNAIYDGTGRLYECMSVGELNIRLRNLADHCLATHKGNLEQREKLIHEIKDIQKTVDQLLRELKEEVMRHIQGYAENRGKREEELVQLQKEKESLELELAHEKNKNVSGAQMTENLQQAIDDQVNAVRKEGEKRAKLLNNDLKHARTKNDKLNKELGKLRNQLQKRDDSIQDLEGRIRDLESGNKDLQGKIDSLKHQLKAKDKQRLSLSSANPQLEARIADLEGQNADLVKDLAAAKNEAKAKEVTIASVNAAHKEFDATLGKKLQDQFDKILEKSSQVDAAQRDTEELKKFYKEQLDRMHQLWDEASQDIKRVFDQNYKDLKARLENAYQEQSNRCDELEGRNKALETRVKDLSNEKENHLRQIRTADNAQTKQQTTIGDLQKKLKALHNQLVDSQVKISQYRVIWNHYMTLEGKLKNEIGHLNNSVSAFEDEMQVEPPMPKRRKVVIGAIREYSNGLHLPLELSEVPTPELLFLQHHLSLRKQGKRGRAQVDKTDIDNQRFLLVNNSRSSHFTLLGQWYLENDRGDKVPLPTNLTLAPGGSLGICMGDERMIASDLLLKEHEGENEEPFITFSKSTDRLYLEDTTGAQMELFSPSLPREEDKKETEDYDIDEDLQGGTIEEASRLSEYLDVQELVRIAPKPYFILINVSKNPIILKDFLLKREKGAFSMKFPEIEMVAGHPVRFLFANKKEYESDILISPRDFGPVKSRDSLLLQDKYGGRHNLLPNMPSPPKHGQGNDDKCYVM